MLAEITSAAVTDGLITRAKGRFKFALLTETGLLSLSGKDGSPIAEEQISFSTKVTLAKNVHTSLATLKEQKLSILKENEEVSCTSEMDIVDFSVDTKNAAIFAVTTSSEIAVFSYKNNC